MGNFTSHIYQAFQHALHELMVSIFDLLVYFLIIIAALVVGKLISMVVRSTINCGAKVAFKRAVTPSPFTPVSGRYRALP
uniref:ORF4a n=1 Tax=Simian hemorrhagic fever virus TaxID=38143 RepID=L0CS08_SHFV|nr:ORF4a [Simian hemorrhagic fever virus]